MVVAGQTQSNGEKVNNLLAGVAAVNSEAEVLAFADIDVQPPEDWLRALVAPLANPVIIVSTGYPNSRLPALGGMHNDFCAA